MLTRLSLLTVLTLLAACSDPVQRMNADIADLLAKPEHSAAQVKVSHVLITFKGAERADKKITRTMREAEAKAAEIYARARSGEDFATLMKESNDSGGGTYVMTAGDPDGVKGAMARSGMVKYFGDVAWRLQVGEIGVAPNHSKHSVFGWHVIKRIE